MPRKVAEIRDEKIVYRVNPRELALLEKRARSHGYTALGTFCRDIALYGVLEAPRGHPSKEGPKPEPTVVEPLDARPDPAATEPPSTVPTRIISGRELFIEQRERELVDAGEHPEVAAALAAAEWRKQNEAQIAAS